MISLLLQSTHSLKIEGLEATSISRLVRGQILMTRFETDAASIADAYDDHPAGLTLARRVFLFRESNADLGDWTGWGAVGVLHQASLFIIHENRVGLIGSNG